VGPRFNQSRKPIFLLLIVLLLSPSFVFATDAPSTEAASEVLPEDWQPLPSEMQEPGNGAGEAIAMITQRMKSLSARLNDLPQPPKLVGQTIDIPVMSRPSKKTVSH